MHLLQGFLIGGQTRICPLFPHREKNPTIVWRPQSPHTVQSDAFPVLSLTLAQATRNLAGFSTRSTRYSLVACVTYGHR